MVKQKLSIKNPKNSKLFVITALVITLIVTAITLINYFVNTSFINQSLVRTMENNLTFAADFAEESLNIRVSLMKGDTAAIADNISSLDGDYSSLEQLVEEQLVHYPDILALTVFDRDGIIVQQGVHDNVREIEEHQFLIDSATRQLPILSLPFYSQESGEFLQNVYVPINSQVNLVASFSGVILSEVLVNHNLWDNSVIFVVNEEGTIVADSNFANVIGQVNLAIDETKEDEGHIAFSEFLERATSRDHGVENITFNGERSIAAFSTLIANNTKNWSVVALSPVDQGPLMEARAELLYAMILLLSVSVILGLVFTRFAVKPFQKISIQNTHIEHRDFMLNLTNNVSKLLISNIDASNFEESLKQSMKLMAESLDVDRVFLTKNITICNEPYYVYVQGWTSDLGESMIDIGSNISYKVDLAWRGGMSQGKVFNGPTHTFTDGLKSFLEELEIRSFLCIPLFHNDVFWGFISFSDCKSERTFMEGDVDILRSTGLLLLSALNHMEQSEVIALNTKRTRAIIDTAPLACLLWNKNYQVVDCNDEAVRLFKINKEELGSDILKIFPMYQPDGTLSIDFLKIALDETFKNGFMESFDVTHLDSDSNRIETSVDCRIIEIGGESFVAAYTRDMREHNRMLADIEENTSLLEKALATAERANNAKTDFLAKMSHEIRTPLNAVIGLSELSLSNYDLDVEVEGNFEKIYSSGITLLNIVNDILDISKIEAGKLELNLVKYETPSLINDVVTQNILRIADKPIEFQLSIDENLPETILGDDLRIRQVLNNVLSNAFKYTSQGIVKMSIYQGIDIEAGAFPYGMNSHEMDGIYLSDERMKGDEFSLVVTISDTGSGIKPEDIKKLFGDFEQFDTRVNRNIEGSGLGLPITKRLIDLMNGKIQVESEYGVGSTFTVVIPQKIISSKKIGTEAVESLKNFKYSINKTANSKRTARIQLPDARVLIVDDNQTNLDVAKGLMKPYGMYIDCVLTGQRAVDLIRSGNVKYNAVFMDHMMPGMDGLEAVKLIREIDSSYAKEIPIIALTANAISGNEKMFLENGFQAFLSKPIDLPKLNGVIKEWIGKQMVAKSLVVDPEILEMVEKTIAGCLSYCIEGLDIKKGLERFGNDEDSYLQVLQSFTFNIKPLLDQMSNMIYAGINVENISTALEQLPDYAICIHGIKGASYSICADVVGDLAKKLEEAAKEENFDYVKENNQGFIEATKKLIVDIGFMLEDFVHKEPKEMLPEPDKELLEKLKEACLAFDADVIEEITKELLSFDYEKGGELVEFIKEKAMMICYSEIALKIDEELSG
jgi:signal transduction histidine kinase/CheY-like chemotaxis protein